MNDHQLRELEKYAKLKTEVKPIARALGWTIREQQRKKGDYPPRFVYLTDGELEIFVETPYNQPERLRFVACTWPTYKDYAGGECRVNPCDTWSPKEPTPETTAAKGRKPEAVANQVKNKLLGEYRRIYDRLTEMAESRQKYADEQAAGIALLFKATRDNKRNPEDKPRFIRGMAGDHVSIEYRSHGSVKIDLCAEEMAAVIDFLREKRGAE